MTVSELIKALQSFPENKNIVCEGCDCTLVATGVENYQEDDIIILTYGGWGAGILK